MLKNRKQAIERASCAKCFGLILGTLGRQGNLKILKVEILSWFYFKKWKKTNIVAVIVAEVLGIVGYPR